MNKKETGFRYRHPICVLRSLEHSKKAKDCGKREETEEGYGRLETEEQREPFLLTRYVRTESFWRD